MPRIGVGYGGLSWKKVRAIVEAVFGDWDGTLVVYEEFVPGNTDQALATPEEGPRPELAPTVGCPIPLRAGRAAHALRGLRRPANRRAMPWAT